MATMGRRGAAVLALLAVLLAETGAFYLPGVAPRKYKRGERMRVKVNTLTSDLTPLQVPSQDSCMSLHHEQSEGPVRAFAP